jgi:hypothetical protein
MPKQLKKSLDKLFIEQFNITNQLFEQYSNTNKDLDIMYNIILIASILLLVSLFKIKRK